MRAGLLPLKRRIFALFWGAGLISDAGTWLQLVTIGTLVAAETGKATKTVLIAAATFAPQGIGSPIGGLLADRYDRRKLLLRTLGLQTLVSIVLTGALAGGQRNPNVLAFIMMFQSLAGALGQPSFQAVIPDLVPKEEVQAAVSLGLTSWNTGRVLGPAISGLFIAAGFGPAWAVGVNAATFVVLWIAVLRARRPFPPAGHPTNSMMSELASGGRLLWRTPGCRFAMLTFIGLHFTIIPFMGLIPQMALNVLKQGRGTVSVLTSAQGVAAIVAALFATTLLARWSRSALLRWALLSSAASSVLYVTSHSVLQATVGIFCLGATVSVLFSMAMGMNQRDAPAAHRGRVLSLTSAAGGTTYGIGLLLFGWLVDQTSMASVFIIGAALQATAAIAFGASAKLRGIVDGKPVEAMPTHRTASAALS
jgi:MFS family permease